MTVAPDPVPTDRRRPHVRALGDAWRTVHPLPDDRDGPLPPLLILCTVVTGVVDAFSYLGLGHVFVANMTGNVVFVAFSIAGEPEFTLWASLLAIAAFLLGALAGGRIATQNRTHRGRLLATAMVVELSVVVGAWIYAEVAGPPFDGPCRGGLIALLGLAMGIQNATARKLAVPDLTTTVLTLTLTGISADGHFVGGEGSKVGRRLLSVCSMFAGALVGALIVRGSHPQLALLVAVGVLAVVVVATLRMRRTDAPWTVPRLTGAAG